MIILKQIFTDYWSQTLILIGILSYFGKRAFDLASKKTEIKYSVYQQNKISSIINFIDCYSGLERKLFHASTIKVVSGQYTLDQFENIFWPKLNKLESASLQLKLFLDEKDIKPYTEIVNLVFQIYTLFIGHYDTITKPLDKVIPVASDVNTLKKNLLKEINNKLTEIGESTRYYFKDKRSFFR